MSAKQANKKLPITIAVLLVMMVGVIALNINTFGGQNQDGNFGTGYRLQAHPPVPSDMGKMVKFAVDIDYSDQSSESRTVVSTSGRDPFFPSKAQPKTVVRQAANHAQVASKSRPKIKALNCSAVMLGGISSLAIINGEGYRLGDKIRGMTLHLIDADGITFQKSNGSFKRMNVGIQESDTEKYRVVTRIRGSYDQGRTSLVNQ